MTGNPHSRALEQPKTFQAIAESIAPRNITDDEYALIKELRAMFNRGKHLQMLVGIRDGKYQVYYVSPHSTLTGGK